MRIMKFGGSSLATIEQIKMRAEQIASVHQSGEPIIVVVSAMGQTTNELANLANQVSPKPHRRELDMLLTTGERVSMALMSMALNDLGCPAISFTGSQAGIFTEDSHNDASIKELKPVRVEEEIKKNHVVVLAGFQGVNPDTKEITTLGRGGSDTTAIAFAHHFKSDKCQVFKDVPGVFSADPKLVDQPIQYEKLSFTQLHNMCLSGAKVIHSKAISLARELGVSFEVLQADPPHKGTWVGPQEENKSLPLSVNLISHLYAMNYPKEKIESLILDIKKSQLTPPKIVSGKSLGVLVFGDTEILLPFANWAQQKYSLDSDLALVTITFSSDVLPTQVADLSNYLGISTESWLSPFGPCCLSLLENKALANSLLKKIHSWIVNGN